MLSRLIFMQNSSRLPYIMQQPGYPAPLLRAERIGEARGQIRDFRKMGIQFLPPRRPNAFFCMCIIFHGNPNGFPIGLAQRYTQSNIFLAGNTNRFVAVDMPCPRIIGQIPRGNDLEGVPSFPNRRLSPTLGGPLPADDNCEFATGSSTHWEYPRWINTISHHEPPDSRMEH